MPRTDLTLDELRAYRSAAEVPADFDEFWDRTLAESRAAGGDVILVPAESPVSELVVEDLTFAGFGGEPIRGWVIRPRDSQPRATVVQYVGYGGGRGLPHEHLHWASSGFVHVVMDTRGQGSTGAPAATLRTRTVRGRPFPGS